MPTWAGMEPRRIAAPGWAAFSMVGGRGGFPGEGGGAGRWVQGRAGRGRQAQGRAGRPAGSLLQSATPSAWARLTQEELAERGRVQRQLHRQAGARSAGAARRRPPIGWPAVPGPWPTRTERRCVPHGNAARGGRELPAPVAGPAGTAEYGADPSVSRRGRAAGCLLLAGEPGMGKTPAAGGRPASRAAGRRVGASHGGGLPAAGPRMPMLPLSGALDDCAAAVAGRSACRGAAAGPARWTCLLPELALVRRAWPRRGRGRPRGFQPEQQRRAAGPPRPGGCLHTTWPARPAPCWSWMTCTGPAPDAGRTCWPRC